MLDELMKGERSRTLVLDESGKALSSRMLDLSVRVRQSFGDRRRTGPACMGALDHLRAVTANSTDGKAVVAKMKEVPSHNGLFRVKPFVTSRA